MLMTNLVIKFKLTKLKYQPKIFCQIECPKKKNEKRKKKYQIV